MVDHNATRTGRRRKPRPLDRARLEELALAYVARFATTAAKLEFYLARKIRERGLDEIDVDPAFVRQLVDRFVDKGFVDDAAFGQAKARDLLARGYGGRRVSDALRAAGVEEGLRRDLAPDRLTMREAARIFAQRRQFGPFGAERDEPADAARKRREKQLAAMVRAGHDFDTARQVVDAASEEEIEEWVAEARTEREG